MKTLLTTIFFVITLFSISGASASAYYYSDIGTSINPLQVQVIKGPFDDLTQQMQQQNLLDALNKQTQAIDNAAFQAQQRQNAQWRASQDAQMNQFWGSGSFGSSNVVPVSVNKDTTPSRDFQNSLDSSCQKSFGGNSLFDASYKSGCGCKKGYSWNSTATACVDESSIPVKTNDQICRESYGVNSLYTGESYAGNTGTPTSGCGCKTGYRWNNDSTACVVPPIVPVKTNDQICKDKWGDTVWDGTKNAQDGLNCDCKAGYKWNQGQTQCVAVPVTPIKTNSQVSFGGGGSLEKAAIAVLPTSKKAPEIKKVQNKIKEKTPDLINDEWKDPAYWNNKVVANAGETRPKSPWEKVKGWFGF